MCALTAIQYFTERNYTNVYSDCNFQESNSLSKVSQLFETDFGLISKGNFTKRNRAY